MKVQYVSPTDVVCGCGSSVAPSAPAELSRHKHSSIPVRRHLTRQNIVDEDRHLRRLGLLISLHRATTVAFHALRCHVESDLTCALLPGPAAYVVPAPSYVVLPHHSPNCDLFGLVAPDYYHHSSNASTSSPNIRHPCASIKQISLP